MKLLEYFRGLVHREGDIGLEVEFEGAIPDGYPIEWKAVREGSVINGAEFVLKRPLSVTDSLSAIRRLKKDFLRFNGKDPEFGIRTSIHVHVNVQQMEIEHILNMIVIYWLVEDLLVDFCGKDRVNNFYCLRRVDAEQIQFLFEDILEVNNLEPVIFEDIRYSSINLTSLGKFGSLEFRAMRGTLGAKSLGIWIKTLMRLKEFSKEFSNPAEVLKTVEEKGIIRFVRELFNKDYYRKSFLKEGWTISVRDNFQELKHLQYLSDFPEDNQWRGREVRINRNFKEVVFDDQFDEVPVEA